MGEQELVFLIFFFCGNVKKDLLVWNTTRVNNEYIIIFWSVIYYANNKAYYIQNVFYEALRSSFTHKKTFPQ